MFGLNEALMSFVRRQVGLRTDAADENGSLHGKVKDIKEKINIKGIIASNNLKFALDTERMAEGCAVVTKSVRILETGSLRLSFQVRSETIGKTAKIYKNDELVEKFDMTSSYTTYTGDFDVGFGDIIKVEVSPVSTSTHRAYIRNFRVFFDYSTGGVNTLQDG